MQFNSKNILLVHSRFHRVPWRRLYAWFCNRRILLAQPHGTRIKSISSLVKCHVVFWINNWSNIFGDIDKTITNDAWRTQLYLEAL